MLKQDRKLHWENIYTSKNADQMSWYQQVPTTSLEIFRNLNLPKSANIIDVGGGDSFFVDHLLDMGYYNITVLDVSETAIDKAKGRLGNLADHVNWIVSDILDFTTIQSYDFWHDRAVFHFLTREDEILKYIEIASSSLVKNGILVLGTFSEAGPKKCSGIEIKQYSEGLLTILWGASFKKINCWTIDHLTPSDSIQNFIFCSLRRK